MKRKNKQDSEGGEGRKQPCEKNENNVNREKRKYSLEEQERILTMVKEKYKSKLVSYAFSILQDEHDAEDAFQLSFISIYTHMDIVSGLDEAAFDAYLYTTVRNTALSMLRSTRLRHAEDIESMEAYLSDERAILPEKKMILQEEVDRVQRAILQMDRIYREVMLLFFIHEYSLDEIARQLGRPKTTIKQQLARGKQNLRKLLCEE